MISNLLKRRWGQCGAGVGKKETEQEDALQRHASLNLDRCPCFRWVFSHLFLPHGLQVLAREGRSKRRKEQEREGGLRVGGTYGVVSMSMSPVRKHASPPASEEGGRERERASEREKKKVGL
jgi:hypothetical protein